MIYNVHIYIYNNYNKHTYWYCILAVVYVYERPIVSIINTRHHCHHSHLNKKTNTSRRIRCRWDEQLEVCEPWRWCKVCATPLELGRWQYLSDTSSDFVIRCGMKQVLGPKNPLVSKQVFGKVFFMCFYECHPRAIRTGPWEQPFLSNHHCLRDREVQGLGSSWRATVAWRYPDLLCEIFEESIRILWCYMQLMTSWICFFFFK